MNCFEAPSDLTRQRATRWCVGFNFVRPRATGYQPTEFKGSLPKRCGCLGLGQRAWSSPHSNPQNAIGLRPLAIGGFGTLTPGTTSLSIISRLLSNPMLLVPTGSENLWCRTQIWGWLKVSHCLLHSNLPANLKHLGPWSGLRKRCGIRNGSCLPQFCHLVATRRIGWTLASWVKSCSIQGRQGTRPANCENKLSGTLIKRCGPSVHVCPWKLSGSPFCF